MTANVLEHCGAQVMAAGTSTDALAAIVDATAAEMPHVLISDIAMAGEDGYELIRRVRKLESRHGGRIPAIALTGYAAPDDIERAKAAGYQMHVAKPMDPAELIQAVAVLVRPADGRRGGS
jgi:CheY-like chemotaxis protein